MTFAIDSSKSAAILYEATPPASIPPLRTDNFFPTDSNFVPTLSSEFAKLSNLAPAISLLISLSACVLSKIPASVSIIRLRRFCNWLDLDLIASSLRAYSSFNLARSSFKALDCSLFLPVCSQDSLYFFVVSSIFIDNSDCFFFWSTISVLTPCVRCFKSCNWLDCSSILLVNSCALAFNWSVWVPNILACAVARLNSLFIVLKPELISLIPALNWVLLIPTLRLAPAIISPPQLRLGYLHFPHAHLNRKWHNQ